MFKIISGSATVTLSVSRHASGAGHELQDGTRQFRIPVEKQSSSEVTQTYCSER